jgi:oligopeptide transport system substrate-binding protein
MRIRSISDGSVFFQEFNHREDRITRNLNFRKAMQATYDSRELVYKVLGVPGYIPGESLFPVFLQGVEGKFRAEYPAPKPEVNWDKAREYLALAKAELGLEEFPPMTLLAGDSTTSTLMAVYFQALYKRVLDLDFKVDIQTFKQRLAKMQAGDYDVVLAGWGPDYEDPMTFADLFASWNTNNHGLFANEELDRKVAIAQNSSDPKTRMDAMGEVQRILIEQVVILPDYERVLSYVQNPQLEGVVLTVTGGNPNFAYARVLPPEALED